MPANPYRNGSIRDGYTRTILAAGFNGIAATTWAAECLTKTCGRSNAGRRFGATLHKFGIIVSPAISFAAPVSGRPCCIGPTTAEKFEGSKYECGKVLKIFTGE